MPKRIWSIVLVATACSCISLCLLLYAHDTRITACPFLNGEEISVAYRNLKCLEKGVQWDNYSTNFSATLFYYLQNQILPSSTVHPQLFKIAFMALLPGLVIVLMVSLVPSVSLFACFFAGMLIAMMPNISWYSIMSTEFMLDTIFSFPLLLLAFRFDWDCRRPRFWLQLSCMMFLTIWVLHFYGASIVVVLISALKLLFDLLRPAQPLPVPRVRLFAICIGATALTVLGLFWPHLIYSNETIHFFFGGGQMRSDARFYYENVNYIFHDMFVQSTSVFLNDRLEMAALPWDQGGVLVLFLAIAGGVSAWGNSRARWLIALSVLSLLIGFSVSMYPGLRRVSPFVIAFCVFAGLGFDAVCRSELGKRNARVALLALFAVMLFSFLKTFLGLSVFSAWSYVSITVILFYLWRISAQRETYLSSHYALFAKQYLLIFLLVPLATFFQAYEFVKENPECEPDDTFTLVEGKSYKETIDYWVDKIHTEEVVFREAEYAMEYVLLFELFCERRYGECVPLEFIPVPRGLPLRCSNE